ncbi:hypothetical protein, partial [Nocardia mexicana]|uniref:hypothetical protein n=1 Tax=Nocardia mexicana TaxID=279262 RepID=UPI001C3FD6C4
MTDPARASADAYSHQEEVGRHLLEALDRNRLNIGRGSDGSFDPSEFRTALGRLQDRVDRDPDSAEAVAIENAMQRLMMDHPDEYREWEAARAASRSREPGSPNGDNPAINGPGNDGPGVAGRGGDRSGDGGRNETAPPNPGGRNETEP